MDLIKMKASDLHKVRDELVSRQKGVCPICKRSLRTSATVNIVVDHCHTSGRVRAALHRRCNSVEGKVLRVLSTWGGASTKPAQRKVLENLLEFWGNENTTEWIYHGHKTETEKRLAINKKRRKQYKESKP